MSNHENEPSKAKQLAAVLEKRAGTSYRGATVQRSHRFPVHYFSIIENMAKVANCNVSTMINQIIEVGVDAMYKELSPEMIQQIHKVSEEQLKAADKTISEQAGKLD